MLSSNWQLSSFLESWSDLALIMYPTFSVLIWCKGKKKGRKCGQSGMKSPKQLTVPSFPHTPEAASCLVESSVERHRAQGTEGGFANIHWNQRPSTQWLVTTESCWASFSVKSQDGNTALSLLDCRLASWGRDTQINYAYAVWLYPLNGSILFQREVYKTFRVHEVDWGHIWENGWMFLSWTWLTQSQLFHQKTQLSMNDCSRK